MPSLDRVFLLVSPAGNPSHVTDPLEDCDD
jgi:hypothetical protein